MTSGLTWLALDELRGDELAFLANEALKREIREAGDVGQCSFSR